LKPLILTPRIRLLLLLLPPPPLLLPKRMGRGQPLEQHQAVPAGAVLWIVNGLPRLIRHRGLIEFGGKNSAFGKKPEAEV
jgi:hypothetical protein